RLVGVALQLVERDAVGRGGEIRRDVDVGFEQRDRESDLAVEIAYAAEIGFEDDRPAADAPVLTPLLNAGPVVDAGWLHQTFALTEREAEICLLAAKGLSDREIAQATDLSFWTVRTHITHVFEKLSVANRTELVHAIFGGNL